jgi:predicted  nucleic acid-binding Zn-ribbon protein
MPHQCVHCSKIYPQATKELIEGCNECGGHFFFYIREEQLNNQEETPIEIPEKEKKKVEKDIREIAGIPDENSPVILDIESVRVLGEGKYEIDVVNLFNKKKPIIYKMEEGKYMIDLSSIVGHKKSEED